jgi:hypothetical protein
VFTGARHAMVCILDKFENGLRQTLSCYSFN